MTNCSEKTILHDNVTVGENGTLRFAGADTASLAAKYGTPLYLVDADRVLARCRLYQMEMKTAFGGDSRPVYAGKAFCVKAIYRMMAECGMSVDLVSSGELFTAKSAGFPMERAFSTEITRPTPIFRSRSTRAWGVSCATAARNFWRLTASPASAGFGNRSCFG